MTIQETIKLTKEAKVVSDETGRDFKEVLAEMKTLLPETKEVKLDLSKGRNMTDKEIAKSNFNKNYKAKEIEDIHAYNRANAIKNMK